MLFGLAEPFMAPVIDCLGGRTLVERAVGGAIEGRDARSPDMDDFWTVDGVLLGGVEFPDDVVEPGCFVGDLVGD